MKRNFVVGLFGGLIGSVILLIVLSAAGIVGARSADVSREEARLKTVSAATPLSSTFTYQGQLKNGGNAVNGSCSMAFRLYDDPTASTNLIGSPITTTVPVTSGLFTVGLNFGSNAFDGNGRWLDIQVNCGSGFTSLTPRQALTAAPYSSYAVSTGALQSYPVTTTAPTTGQVLKWNGSAWIPDVDAGGTAYSAGFGLNLVGTVFNVVTSTIQQRVGSSCAAGNAIRVVNQDGSVACEPVSSGGGWGLTGNSGTNPNTNFLGTTDNVSLTLRVSNTAALRIMPNATSPNIIGGYSGNFISSTVVGSVIGGGGEGIFPNRVQADFATVGGGKVNIASGLNSTIGGGSINTASGLNSTIGGGGTNTASGYVATVGGGAGNIVSNTYATIGGGYYNTASGSDSTVGGGDFNTASFSNTTVSGGYRNTASGAGAFVGGGGYDGTTIVGNQATGNASAIGGGLGNTASAAYGTVGGGYQNTASAISGDSSTVAGGYQNNASNDAATVGGGFVNNASGPAATVSGGFSNTASGDHASIGGGWVNMASGPQATVSGGISNTASGSNATVSGGISNTASGAGAFVGGGGNDGITNAGNRATGAASTIGGGLGNTVSNTYATVGGGISNTASGLGAFVGGGGYDGFTISGNKATGAASTIGGGWGNTVSNTYATVGGGENNTASGYISTVSGGHNNTASGYQATVGGGGNNYASGWASTVPGGEHNSATGDWSFAAGYYANTNNYNGSFVWGDSSTAADMSATAPNQFLIRASNGVGINTNTPATSLQVAKDFANSGGLGQIEAIGATNNAKRLTLGFDTTGNIGWIQASETGVAYRDLALNPNGGNIGVGTASPSASYRLDVNGKVHASGGFNGQCLNGTNFNATASSSCNMDVAEAFGSTEQTEPGDLVMLATEDTAAPTVHKSSQPYAGLLVGVVSQNPGLIFDNGQTNLAGDNSKLITVDKTVVALVGRVNVKVSMENGFVAIGDPLTSSSTPGVAMKATRAGKIVGYAMGIANANGTVLALVQPGYYLPTDQLATQIDSTPSFNLFNLLSVIAFAGFAFMWLQQRRSKRGQA